MSAPLRPSLIFGPCRLRLLDVQLLWPPDAQVFVANRLRALHAAGVDVAAVVRTAGRLDRSLAPYAHLIRLPARDEARLGPLARSIQAVAWALVRRPRRVCRILAGVRPATGSGPIGALRALLRMAPLLHARPDIIHFEWLTSAIDYRWLPDLLGRPYVVSCRGRQVNVVPFMSGQEDFRAELADVFQEAAAVHCVSRHIAEVAVGLGLPPEKARVIYTAVDTDFFRPDPRIRKPGPFEIASVGSAIWRKGYEYLLLALRHLIDVGIDARLRIADFGGPERERIRYTAEDLGLGDRVHLLGRLAPDGVRELLQTSDLFALATLSEGISNAVVEAMACSLPVVVSDCGGMREAVTDGVEGLVVPTRSPHAMAEAIAQLATAPALRSEMGRAGRDRAVRDFSMARQAREFIALYKEILCARPQAAKAVSPAAPDGPGAAGEADASGVDVARSPDDPGHSAGKPRPLRILTVADLDWRNGHEYAVQAMRELDRRGVSFEYWIIGRGPFHEAIAFAIHELGLGDRVRVILGEAGAFDGGTPEIADVFLLAAVGDGASSAIAAAADRGLAIVCTELARPINLAARDPWIQIIPGRDPAAIADRLTTLAASIYQTK